MALPRLTMLAGGGHARELRHGGPWSAWPCRHRGALVGVAGAHGPKLVSHQMVTQADRAELPDPPRSATLLLSSRGRAAGDLPTVPTNRFRREAQRAPSERRTPRRTGHTRKLHARRERCAGNVAPAWPGRAAREREPHARFWRASAESGKLRPARRSGLRATARPVPNGPPEAAPTAPSSTAHARGGPVGQVFEPLEARPWRRGGLRPTRDVALAEVVQVAFAQDVEPFGRAGPARPALEPDAVPRPPPEPAAWRGRRSAPWRALHWSRLPRSRFVMGTPAWGNAPWRGRASLRARRRAERRPGGRAAHCSMRNAP